MNARAPLIAVDLTPMRPGGEGGGNKLVALSILAGLRRRAPEWRLLLLTAHWNHDELSGWDAARTERLCVLPAAAHDAAAQGPLAGALLSARGADLLFCPFTPPTYAEPTLRVVSLVHDLQVLSYPQFFDPQDAHDRLSQLEQLRWLADAVVCVSDYTRRSLLRRFPIPARRVSVIGHGVHARLAPRAEGEAAAVRVRLGLARRPYAFYPANFWPHKNHAMLLLALAQLRAERPDLGLDLAFSGAPGPAADELRRAAHGMGLADRVHFLGFLDDADLGAVYQGCAFVIFPSLYEGFGIPLLEAMRFGRPLACSRVTSLPEVAGDAALYFDPRRPRDVALAMLRLATDRTLAEELVKLGGQRLAELPSQDPVEEYHRLFSELLAQPKTFANAVSGVWSDGWLGEQVSLTCGPGAPGRVWELRLRAPDAGALELEVSAGADPSGAASRFVPRGQSLWLRIPVGPQQGQIVLALRPSFQPEGAGAGADTRRLSGVVDVCRLVLPDGLTCSPSADEREAPRLAPTDLASRHIHGFRPLVADWAPFEEGVSGVFEDGWTSDVMAVTIGAGPAGRAIELRFAVPPWHPAESVRIRGWGTDLDERDLLLPRGAEATLEIPLHTAPARLFLELTPGFRPSADQRSPDRRWLGAVLRDCRVVSLKGTARPLPRL